MIALRGLTVVAGAFAVGPVDLRLDDGEYGVLLGPSGAGKSLVLEAVAGVRAVTAGTVVLDGIDVTGLVPERRRVGLVFQDGLLFPHLSVAANIAYGTRAAGRDRRALGRGEAPAAPPRRRDRDAEVRRLAAEVGVTGLLERSPATLSGGERQRVALARALAARPRVLLLDEPLSAVDAEAREGLQAVLHQVCRAEGLPVLHVTHDRAEAFALADICAVMIAGELHQTGPPLEVLRRPADESVARFLGARNVLTARRDSGDPSVACLSAGGALRVSKSLPAGDVVVVVRPEDLRLEIAAGAAGSAPGDERRAGRPPGRLTATVTRLTLQGGHVLVGLEAPALLEALVPVGALDAAGIGVGSSVAVAVAPADVHVLPSPR